MKYYPTFELTFQECCDLHNVLSSSGLPVCLKVMQGLSEIIELHDDSEELRAISRMVERDREAMTGENSPAEELE